MAGSTMTVIFVVGFNGIVTLSKVADALTTRDKLGDGQGVWDRQGGWRRVLLKKYAAAGIRSVPDEGDDEIEGVSPAIHQTCHHWAWDVQQDVLDQTWDRA
jgi:hypothetical protein